MKEKLKNRIKELFDRYYSQHYELINIEFKDNIRHSIFTFKCKTCGQVIKKEGKYLYKSKPVPKHNCYLNKEYNYIITKKELENRLKYLKKNSNKDFKLVNFTKEWFLKNFKTRSKTKIILQCTKHPQYQIKTTINNFLNDSGFFGCKICANEQFREKYKKSLSEIKQDLQKLPKHFKYPDLDWFSKNYQNSYTFFPIYCVKHYYLNSKFNLLKLRNGTNPCPFCSGKLLKYEDFLKRAKKIHYDQYEYLISKYEWYNEYKNKKFKIKIKCKICNSIFEQKIINHLDGYGCPYCSASKGERKIQMYLEKNNIKFEYQKIIKENQKIKFIFDFYIPEYNLAIEYDGEPHYKEIDIYGGKEGLKERQKRDQLKNQYCKENGINLLRIPYWDFEKIEEILEQVLAKNL